VAAIAAAPAFAHHSFNAYDMSKTETVSGVSGSPLAFAKQGLAPRDFHRGDKVTVTYHPNTSGGAGGAIATLTLPDGKTYKDTEAAAAGPPGAPPPPTAPPGK